jgi:hypothetical protein
MADKSRLWASIKEELGSGILNALNDIRQRVVEEGMWGRIATPDAGVKADPVSSHNQLEQLPPRIDSPSANRRYTGEEANHFALQKAMNGDLESHEDKERASIQAQI